MYFFASCPFKDETPQEEVRCFDTDSAIMSRRPRDMVARYCFGEFRGCPYYQIQGTPSLTGGREGIFTNGKKAAVSGGVK
ncbi:MAG: hypothetical protein O2807_05145 [bacterium]|nr:hypothetical protein [bacterium]